MIEARNVTHRIGAVTLLSDVSLAVEAGQVLGIVGPNGAGKSTLLRILAGEIAPTAGEVHMAGRDLRDWSIRDRAKLRAVLPQQSELSFPFSAFDVVLLGRSPHVDAHETLHDRSIARLAMSLTGTLGFDARSYPTLSGGERQRVHAARALAQIWEGPGFRVLMLDEPTASLDVAHQHAVLRLARRMAEDHCAVICVLHDLNLAAQYADTVAVMHHGRVVEIGRPLDVLSRKLLADVFDMDAIVVAHPRLSCPLVVAMGPSRGRSDPPVLNPGDIV